METTCDFLGMASGRNILHTIIFFLNVNVKRNSDPGCEKEYWRFVVKPILVRVKKYFSTVSNVNTEVTNQQGSIYFGP